MKSAIWEVIWILQEAESYIFLKPYQLLNIKKKPKLFKEQIIASKVAGENNGISFNQAEEVKFDFYENSFNIDDAEMISPIANNAFSYYEYKLVGTIYNKNGRLINKIQLIPKRKNDRVFSGHIYIVENDWAIYGVDVLVSGMQAGILLLVSVIRKNSTTKENI